MKKKGNFIWVGDVMKGLIEKYKINENELSKILTAIMEYACLKDGDGYWVDANEAIHHLLDMPLGELIGKKDQELAKRLPRFKEIFEDCIVSDEETWSKRTVTEFEWEFLNKGGIYQIVKVYKIPFYHQDGSRKAILMLGQEITFSKLKELELDTTIKELADFKFALDESSIVATTDHKGKISYVNHKFCEISKCTREELIGKDHRIINSGYHSKAHVREMWETIQNGKVWYGEFRNRAKDGTYYWVKTTIVPFVDANGKPYQYMSIRQDISKQKEIGEQILFNAYHDELTGLRNRRCFREEIIQWIAQSRKNDQLALIFIDLNRFKYINDTLSHMAGDQLLIDVANRLQEHLTHQADLYRFGGDEFIIVLKNQTKHEVEEFVQHILTLFLQPFYLQQRRLYITASLGVSLYPEDALDASTLLKKADSAMYLAKEHGVNGYQFYPSGTSRHISKRMNLESDLRHAVKENEFVLFYQPKIHLPSGQITGAEALIRWNHPTKGMVSPSEFIPLAEETGLIIPMTEWVLEEACKQNKKWKIAGFSNVKMGVNISSVLFKKDIVGMVNHILDDTGLQPSDLDLEITESSMQTPELTIPILHQLKRIGVSLSIDDFGTGYSSLAYLRDFPIDRLKIDRSFVAEISSRGEAIIDMIINMAAYLQVRVVAEGIETQEQLSYLKNLSCNEGQGYLFSRPVPAKDFERLLFRQKKSVV
ncbi:EAL domain-containing protein [Niallia sp. Krafla_26]|uniref:EAL domain-containing protein n=1 Tax=Niallia sp. Krafla_26 TaxID=3064703 RepID=UPI003D177956